MAKVDWTKLKKEYIANETVSHKSLSEKYHVSDTVISERASKEKWMELRKQTLAKASEKMVEKTSDKIAEFQAEKLKIGKYMVGEGLKAMQDKKPRNAREAKEVIEVGYKIATEAMDLDKKDNTAEQFPTLIQVNFNFEIDGYNTLETTNQSN